MSGMRSVARCVLLTVAVCLIAPGGAEAVRVRGLDAIDAFFAAGPGRMLSGDRVVYATPGGVYAWPVTGGRPRRIGATPDLGSAENSLTDGGGFIRVEAAQPGRIVVARGGNSALSPDFGSGHQLAVGPPEGPFADPAGCGESSGMPAVLDGTLLAYHAEPAPAGACPSAPEVTAPAIVIRDLADGNGVRNVIALADDVRVVSQLELAGDYLAYSGAPRRTPQEQSLFVVDARTGEELFSLPASRRRLWALDDDGTVVTGRSRFVRGVPCPFEARHLRSRSLGLPAGRPLPGIACALGVFDVRGGVLRYAAPRDDGRQDVVAQTLADGSRTVLATIAGLLVDADEAHLLAGDDTCTTSDMRVLSIIGGHPQGPAGPRRCPVHVRVARRVRGDRGDHYRVRVRCPRGCMLDVEARTYRGEWTYGSGGHYRFRRGGTFRVPIPLHPGARGAVTHLTIAVRNPAGSATVIRRRVRLVRL
jgi:hypothetical protein